MREAVVITGCSSGIGRATALACARAGYYVFATVRRVVDGTALSAAAGAVGVGGAIEPVLADVTNPSEVAALAARVAAWRTAHHGHGHGRLVGLVNNAGIAAAGPVEEAPLARLRAVLEVNVIGTVAVTQALLPLLHAGRGRVIALSSVSGRLAPPFLGPYAASKFAVEALSDALRVEVRRWGIKVVLIEPGAVATPIWEKGQAQVLADRQGVPDGAASPYAGAVAPLRAAFARAAASSVAPDEVAAAVVVALRAPRP